MIEVIGDFDTIVPVPIIAAPDLINSLNSNGSLPGPLTFSIGDSEVEVSLGEQAEPVSPEDGEFPRIKSFRVRIPRHVAVQFDAAGRETLTRGDEQEFEDILVEAMKRIVSAIKKRTEQSSIDTRHPVHGYRYSYCSDNGTVIKGESPPEPGSYKMPRYALGSLAGILTPFRPPGELDEAMWADIQDVVHSSVALPLYDELIHDAKTLQAAMEYQLATLSAAIAVELMLHEICSLLGKKPPANAKIPWLLNTIRRLDPSMLPNLKTVIMERNAIAHGESRNIDPERMAEIINKSHEVRKCLMLTTRRSNRQPSLR